MSDFLKYANYVFTGIFIIEGVLKIFALGIKKYIKERYNSIKLSYVFRCYWKALVINNQKG